MNTKIKYLLISTVTESSITGKIS